MAIETHELPQTTAIASLPPDMAILKLENETIQSLAAARPRDMEHIKNELVAQLHAFPALADAAIYAKPVGKDPETGEQRLARGLSVRSAEVLAEAYGFNRVRVDVTTVDADHVKVEATFTDYQRGRIWQDGGILSKFYKDKYGKMSRTPDDRFYNVVVKAEASRRVREVILRSVNAGLKAWFWNECERMLDERLDDKTVEAIFGRFNAIGVTADKLEDFIGRPRSMGWTGEDRQNLLGIWNAIKDGESSVAEAFGAPDPKPVQGAPPAGTANGNGSTNGSTNDALKNPKKAAPASAAAPAPVEPPKAQTPPAPVTTAPVTPAPTPEVSGKSSNPASPFETFKSRLSRATTPQKVADLTKTWCADDGPLTEAEREAAYELATVRDQELRFEQQEQQAQSQPPEKSEKTGSKAKDKTPALV
jgi:hypothetical protein